MKRQASEAELKQSLAIMRESVEARLELKKPRTLLEGGSDAVQDTLKRLWERFFTRGD